MLVFYDVKTLIGIEAGDTFIARRIVVCYLKMILQKALDLQLFAVLQSNNASIHRSNLR